MQRRHVLGRYRRQDADGVSHAELGDQRQHLLALGTVPEQRELEIRLLQATAGEGGHEAQRALPLDERADVDPPPRAGGLCLAGPDAGEVDRVPDHVDLVCVVGEALQQLLAEHAADRDPGIGPVHGLVVELARLRLRQHVGEVGGVLRDDDPRPRLCVLDRDEPAGQADVRVDDGGIQRAPPAGDPHAVGDGARVLGPGASGLDEHREPGEPHAAVQHGADGRRRDVAVVPALGPGDERAARRDPVLRGEHVEPAGDRLHRPDHGLDERSLERLVRRGIPGCDDGERLRHAPPPGPAERPPARRPPAGPRGCAAHARSRRAGRHA